MNAWWWVATALYAGVMGFIVLATYWTWKEWAVTPDVPEPVWIDQYREERRLALAYGGACAFLLLVSWELFVTKHGAWAAVLFLFTMMVGFIKFVRDIIAWGD